MYLHIFADFFSPFDNFVHVQNCICIIQSKKIMEKFHKMLI